MSFSALSSLSSELKSIIIEFIDNGDEESLRTLLKLSEVSWSFRTLSVPKIFRAVTVDASEWGADKLSELAQSSLAEHVETLSLRPRTLVEFIESDGESNESPRNEDAEEDVDGEEDAAERDDGTGEDEKEDEEGGDAEEGFSEGEETFGLPEEIAEILSDLSCFPNLKTFVLDYEWFDTDPETIFTELEAEEDIEKILEEEKTREWRAVLARAYAAIAKNEDRLKSFTVANIIAKQVSFWSQPEFHTFLNSLDAFSLSVGSYEPQFGLNIADGYITFWEGFPQWFYDHLTNLTTFRLISSNCSPLGFHSSHLGLQPGHMPRLKELSISKVLICPELHDFIAKHGSLESIVLEDCWAEFDRGITWDVFFRSITTGRPPSLKSFKILPHRATLKVEGYLRPDEYDIISRNAEAIKEILKTNPSRMLFAYADLHYRAPSVQMAVEKNIKQFNHGDDEREYQSLMEYVKRNNR
jgi:hypothetical protein